MKVHKLFWIYMAVVVIFALYEQPWNKTAWTSTDGVDMRGTALLYTIFWPYAIYVQGTAGSLKS